MSLVHYLFNIIIHLKCCLQDTEIYPSHVNIYMCSGMGGGGGGGIDYTLIFRVYACA